MSKFFAIYGELCAAHPWEVIIAVTTITTSFLTVEKQQLAPQSKKPAAPCNGCIIEEHFQAADVIVMTAVRCIAILYGYHQFKHLQNLGSKYILGIAGLFVVFSSFVFTSTVLNLLQIELVDLKDALFFFLLLIDLSKAAKLTQFALTSPNQEEITKSIARGMSVLGPTITLDTIVETLVIGVGTLSGVNRLETLSYFACLSVIVNYIIFMTFYPACLALMLELGRISDFYGEERAGVIKRLLEENEKSNPVVQRVKMIMSLGLLMVHIHSRWGLSADGTSDSEVETNKTDCLDNSSSFYGFIMKQFAISADHIVILILLVTLMVKLIFFENKQPLNKGRDVVVPWNFERQKRTISTSIQTEDIKIVEELVVDSDSTRSLPECLKLYREDQANKLSDKDIINLVDTKHIPPYMLEKAVKNPERGVRIRRKILENTLKNDSVLMGLPYQDYDYGKVMGACCENVVGYVPLPVGVAGPLLLDNERFYIPLATTEGCLVASTNRGCRATEKTGIKSRVVSDGMTRGPLIRFQSIIKASEAMQWVKTASNFALLKEAFDSTSRFAKLQKLSAHIAGRYLFVRFSAETGDAMGMNMVSKGTEKALETMKTKFPDMEVLSLSGNVCTDKKPAAINWIEGRGKSVVCECVIPASVVASVLKTTTHAMVDLNISKNMIGSAIAGSIGGFNAHSANIVTAIFIATGQDAAQNVSSSNCLTIFEPWGENGEDLYASCTMPSIEIGTVGGGTVLPAQSTCLNLLGIKGANETSPGDNAKKLARIVCGTVLAGEVSLIAALASGHLVKSHLKYNRSVSSRDETELGCDNSVK